jgi:hypothetical protein
MHSLKEIEQAKELRKNGKSYNEIVSILHIPKSTLYTWLENIELSTQAQNRIDSRVHDGSKKGLIKRNINQTKLAIERSQETFRKSKTTIGELTTRELLLIGTALYWGEGYKKQIIVRNKNRTYHPVSLSNSDPELIKMFLLFLRKCLNVDESKIRLSIHMYDGMDENKIIKYWQEITRIPKENMGKVYRGVSISSKRTKKYNHLPYGTAQIRVSSTELFYKIMGLIKGIQEA